MLLNREVTSQTEYLSYTATQAGLLIQPKSGTLLETLVSKYMMNPDGATRDGNGAIVSVAAGEDINRGFDDASEAFIRQMVTGVRAELHTARNVFKPLVARVVETFNEMNVEENMEMFTPTIILKRLPDIFNNNMFCSLIEEQDELYDSTRAIPGKDTRINFPKEIDPSLLRGVFSTGIESFDSRLELLSSNTKNTQLLELYNAFFVDGYGVVGRLSVEEAVVVYLMVTKFERGLPDGCSGISDVFSDSLLAFRNRVANVLFTHQTSYSRLVTNKVLVLDYVKQDSTHVITVVPEVYNDIYLRNGGTPETLLGAMLLNVKPEATITFMLEPMFLKDCDNKYNLVREVAINDVENRKASIAMNNLRGAVNKLLEEIYEEGDKETLFLTGERSGVVERANAYIENTTFTTETSINVYVLGLLGSMCENGDLAAKLLGFINKTMSENPKLTPQDACNLYVEYRVTDWFALLSERVA